MRARHRLQSCALWPPLALALLPALSSLSGCSRGGAPPVESDTTPGDQKPQRDMALPMPDLSEPRDAAVDPQRDAGPGLDGGSRDMAGMAVDMAMPVDMTVAPDLATPADMTLAPDMAFASSQDVDIYVDNFCRMDVIPKKFDVPGGTSLKLTYRNRSRDYPVDVWLSYGGGFLDLKTGMTWADRFEFCRFPRPYMAYADISTACSRYRLMINCL